MPRNLIDQVGETATRIAPPTGVAGLTFVGISVPDWVLILTILYLVLQIGGWVYDRFFKGVPDDG